MISVKEAIRYLSHFLSDGPAAGVLRIDPETIRKAKLNDPTVADSLLRSLCDLVGFLNKFRLSDNATKEEQRNILSLYLSLHKNPFEMQIRGESFYNLTSSRALLKILAWLLFSAEDFLGKLDRLLQDEVLSLEKISVNLRGRLAQHEVSVKKELEVAPELTRDEDAKNNPTNVVRVPGQKYAQLAPLKERNMSGGAPSGSNTQMQGEVVNVNDKHSTAADTLNKILSIQDNQVLKTMLLLKMDKIMSMSKHHKKVLNRILSTLGGSGQHETHNSDVLSLLGMLISPEQTGQIVEQLDQANERVKGWTKDLSLRKSCIEWLDSLNDEDKKQTGTFSTTLSEQELMFETNVMMTKKYVAFDDLYQKIDSQLKELEKHAEAVKEFGHFWAETSKSLASGPTEYRKIMTGVIARENAKLIPKYKSRAEEKQLTTYQAQTQAKSDSASLDFFRLAVSEKLGPQHMMNKPKKPINLKSAGIKHGHASPAEDVSQPVGNVFQSLTPQTEYEEFLDEVQEFLTDHNISMIRYRR